MPFKVRIKEWRTFASWHWETGDEKQCGICRNPFDAICGTGDCNQPGDKCPMISGKCAHKFHYHCIRKWLSVSTNHDQTTDRSNTRASWKMSVQLGVRPWIWGQNLLWGPYCECKNFQTVTIDFSNRQVILNVHYVVHHGNTAIQNFTKQFVEKALLFRPYQCPI